MAELKTEAYTVKNEAPGARGVFGKIVDPGTTVVLELTEDEALLIGEFEGVEVEAKKPETKPRQTAKTKDD